MRQHYIPRLHLKHFTGAQPAGQVWTYDKTSGEMRSSTPENTAVQTHFYSIEKADGEMDLSLEKFLSETEGKAAPVYEGFLKGRMPDDQGLADFANFLALMYVRTPAMRQMAADMRGQQIQVLNFAYATNDRAFNSLISRYEKARGVPFAEHEKERLRQDCIDPSSYVLKIPKEDTLSLWKVADKIAPIFYEMDWSLIDAAHGFFITSDNPLVRMVDPKTISPFYGDRGFMNKTAEITFPLSPKRMLVLTRRTSHGLITSVNREVVDGMNLNRATHADRYLYAHLEHSSLQKLARKYKNSRPKVVLKGAVPKAFSKVEVPRKWKET